MYVMHVGATFVETAPSSARYVPPVGLLFDAHSPSPNASLHLQGRSARETGRRERASSASWHPLVTSKPGQEG